LELGFSKNELASSIDKRPWIDPVHPSLTIQQQCELLGVPRSVIAISRDREGKESQLRSAGSTNCI
jgi:hypothetical protein